MIQLEEKHRQLIKEILLKEAGIDFYVFGSRVKGDAARFSDLDLAYRDELSKSSLLNIKTRLAESDLPFTVDIVNLNDCDKSFLELVEKDLQIL